MSPGQRVVSAYFLIFYVLPWLGTTWAADRIDTVYLVEPLNGYGAFMAAATYVLAMALTVPRAARGRGALSVRPPMFLARVLALFKVYERWRVPIALGALGLTARYYVDGLSTYRYSELGISETASPLLLFVILLNILIGLEFFCRIILERAGNQRRSMSRRVGDLVLAGCLVLQLNGTASALMAFGALAYAIHPATVTSLLFAPVAAGVLRRVAATAIALVLGIGLFALAWTMGETIKRDVTGQVDTATMVRRVVDDTVGGPEWIQEYAFYLLSSVSHPYYALTFTTTAPRDLFASGGTPPLVLPINTFLFRLDFLLGGVLGFDRPVIGSLSRLNFVLLSVLRDGEREGTSPGLLASFTYATAFPFDILLAVGYTSFLIRLVDTLLSSDRRYRLTTVGVSFVLGYVLFMFQSPLDFIVLIDHPSLSLGGLLVVAAGVHQHTRARVGDAHRLPQADRAARGPGASARPALAPAAAVHGSTAAPMHPFTRSEQ